ncbi:MAG: hypothetical protein ACO1O1_02510 [Adhaeribacter sp.]
MTEAECVNLRANVLLCATRALLGAITPSVRGITVDYNREFIKLRAYFDIGATEEEKELISDAHGEIIGDFPEMKAFPYEVFDLPFPEKMQVLSDWIYMRYERIEK